MTSYHWRCINVCVLYRCDVLLVFSKDDTLKLVSAANIDPKQHFIAFGVVTKPLDRPSIEALFFFAYINIFLDSCVILFASEISGTSSISVTSRTSIGLSPRPTFFLICVR